MSLADRLRDDLTAAMKARDELTTATLRMVLSAVKGAEVAGEQARTLSDDEVAVVVAKEAKRREEAAEAFRAAGRSDRADRELAEREVLARYLPERMGRDEIERVVAEVLAAEGLSGLGSMGQAMKAVMARLGGAADGKLVSEVVRERLSGR
ncbi:MAG TPA: GatB/YqeY domain-containing protein [Actinomycetota bacterium]|nr:GatB/YqeY domain-containing protein [Actinomycetota bacterium]